MVHRCEVGYASRSPVAYSPPFFLRRGSHARLVPFFGPVMPPERTECNRALSLHEEFKRRLKSRGRQSDGSSSVPGNRAALDENVKPLFLARRHSSPERSTNKKYFR